MAQCLLAGYSTAQTAGALDASLYTARNHIQNVIAKLGAHSRVEAIALLRR